MIIVSKDSSGDFKTIKEAINSIPQDNRKEVKIFIKNGIYKEKLNIESDYITLIGEDAIKTVITFNDYAKKKFSNGELYRTFNSYTVFVQGNNFSASNLTIENSSGSGDDIGQAVALYVEGSNAKFKNCRLIGCQDTLFTGPLPESPIEGNDFGGPMEGKPRIVGRQYYEECYIEGDVDFIFGSAIAVFNKCEIFSKNRNKEINGYITAASTPRNNEFGYVFIDCRLTGNATKDSVYLGRPWRDYAKTVFINCYLGSHIKKEGWHSWDKELATKEAYYGEYKSYGPGEYDSNRAKWSHILTEKEVEKYINLSNGLF